VGTHIGNNGSVYHDLTRPAILASVEASRRRLALDVIPLLYLHGPSISELDNQLLDTLSGMRDRGWVRWYGVNSFDTDVLESLADILIFDVVMLDYNVIKACREPTIAKLTQSGKLVVAGAAMANHLYAPGFLWPKSRADVWYALRVLKNYRRDFLRARRFSSLGTYEGWTPAQVALAFVLSNDQVGTAMFGTTRLQHLEENIAACGLTLPDILVKQIRS
jgi:1-deoxyxylulose-5-phosphate synthase